jgi:hypothetical protein
MKPAKNRGMPIDAARKKEWADRFRFYRASPGETEIDAWLKRFPKADLDIAARLLDSVEVISEPTIQAGYKRALTSVTGWHKKASLRQGRWVFTAFGKPGESGLSMLRMFSEANGLTGAAHEALFKHIIEIPKLKLTAADTIVLVDDFAGTGRQVCQRWPTLAELIASEARCFIVLTAATKNAIKKIQEQTELEVIVDTVIQPNEDIFASSCIRFDDHERTAILQQCEKADSKNPKGFGECGLLYVLSHKTPNNSIPILHTNHNGWVGLFPRNLQQQ